MGCNKLDGKAEYWWGDNGLLVTFIFPPNTSNFSSMLAWKLLMNKSKNNKKNVPKPTERF